MQDMVGWGDCEVDSALSRVAPAYRFVIPGRVEDANYDVQLHI
jgi:hypothetical protein